MMERKMHDQLDETNASKHLRSVAFETCLLVQVFSKGHLLSTRNIQTGMRKETTVLSLKPSRRLSMKYGFHPDPDARNMSEAEFTVQRRRLNRSQMRGLNADHTFVKKASNWH